MASTTDKGNGMVIDSSSAPAWFVELQVISAFTQNSLSRKVRSPNSIAKNLPYEVRARDPAWQSRNAGQAFTLIPVPSCPTAVYNIWGIRNPRAPASQRLRPYRNAPLMLAREHLTQATPSTVNVKYESKFNVSQYDRPTSWYDRWHLTNEPTLPGVGSQNIRRFLPDIPANEIANWDSYGIALVSPIFSTNGETTAEGTAQIGAVTNALNQRSPATDDWRAFVNNSCSLNVSVAVPREHLNMLGFLTTIYEVEMSQMHPVCRHPAHNGQHHKCTHYRAETTQLGLLYNDLKRSPAIKGPPAHIDPHNPISYGSSDVSNRALETVLKVFDIYDGMIALTHPAQVGRLLNWPADDKNEEFAYGRRERQVNYRDYGMNSLINEQFGEAGFPDKRERRMRRSMRGRTLMACGRRSRWL